MNLDLNTIENHALSGKIETMPPDLMKKEICVKIPALEISDKNREKEQFFIKSHQTREIQLIEDETSGRNTVVSLTGSVKFLPEIIDTSFTRTDYIQETKPL